MRQTVSGALVAIILAVGGAAADTQAEAEVAALVAKVKGFQVVELKPGRNELTAADGLTIAELRGVALDDRPPVVGPPAKPYDPRMTDDYPAGEAPYVARGIAPFRFRFFHCEFQYGGWHNWGMTDYAAAHGFDILTSYNRHLEVAGTRPAGTRLIATGGFINWDKWLEESGTGQGRWDLAAGVDLQAMLSARSLFRHDPRFDYLMIDLEHGVLSPDALRQQAWYPQAAGPAEREAFEQRYYAGYQKTYVATVQTARAAGFKNISLYGWQPFPRTWGGLEKTAADPLANWQWQRYGRGIYDVVDLLNPSVYCFYWNPANVAYTLANLDANLAVVAGTGAPKPIRPYYWTLLHGGGGGWRWWQNQPIADEESRAMVALALFCGIDGLVSWNWSGTGNHHRPAVAKDADLMLGRPLTVAPVGGGQPVELKRYDVVHVQELSDGRARFQRIERDNFRNQYGCTPDRPVYELPAAELTAHLRPLSEPVAAMIEGLALVKPVEYLLRHGQPKIVVPAAEQFAKQLPIVRRMVLDGLQVVITYDPKVVYGGAPRTVELTDLDGQAGQSLVLPADAQVRLFVLRQR